MFYFKVKLSTSTFFSYMVYHLHAVGYWILPMAVDTGCLGLFVTCHVLILVRSLTYNGLNKDTWSPLPIFNKLFVYSVSIQQNAGLTLGWCWSSILYEVMWYWRQLNKSGCIICLLFNSFEMLMAFTFSWQIFWYRVDDTM